MRKRWRTDSRVGQASSQARPRATRRRLAPGLTYDRKRRPQIKLWNKIEALSALAKMLVPETIQHQHKHFNDAAELSDAELQQADLD